MKEFLSTLWYWAYNRDVFVLILDKLVIAGLLIVLGVLAKWYVDRRRDAADVAKALAPRRIEAIGEIQTSIDASKRRLAVYLGEVRSYVFMAAHTQEEKTAPKKFWSGELTWDQLPEAVSLAIEGARQETGLYRSGLKDDAQRIRERIRQESFWLGPPETDRLMHQTQMLSDAFERYADYMALGPLEIGVYDVFDLDAFYERASQIENRRYTHRWEFKRQVFWYDLRMWWRKRRIRRRGANLPGVIRRRP